MYIYFSYGSHDNDNENDVVEQVERETVLKDFRDESEAAEGPGA
jgi:hypothetical protein